jgi:ABC-2 type transport system ATP-binding protein
MSVAALGVDASPRAARLTAVTAPAVEVDGVHRRFGPVEALRGVDLEVAAGEVHALLGANGAGKTTLMRVLCGLVEPSEGSAYVLDRRAGRAELRQLIGFVPSGDRSFYLRLSGLENLLFFGRLHGLRRRPARDRALALLDAVGLGEAARRPVNTYSHGMQKRLSFARALLSDPAVLLVDEATHDLDPLAAEQVRELTLEHARAGCAVVWATQRIEELSGFADRVTVLDRGTVRFAGTVTALVAAGGGHRHVIGLGPRTAAPLAALDAALGPRGTLQPAGESGHAVLALAPGVALGTALATLIEAGAELMSCRDETPPVERGFRSIVAEDKT